MLGKIPCPSDVCIRYAVYSRGPGWNPHSGVYQLLQVDVTAIDIAANQGELHDSVGPVVETCGLEVETEYLVASEHRVRHAIR